MEIVKERYNFIDWGKAIGIALICIGHFCPRGSMSRIFLYTFHVPLFFLIGGFLCRKANNTSLLKRQYKKETKRLLFPYVFWFLLSSIPAIFIFKGDISSLFKKFLFLDGTMIWNSVLWFIPCFYMASVVFQAIICFISDKKITLILIALSGFALAAICDKYEITTCLFGLNKVALLIGYYATGYLLKQCWETILINRRMIRSGCVFLFFITGIISCRLNKGDNISILNLDYNYIYIYPLINTDGYIISWLSTL